jgi:hypothetical protein
VEVKFGSPGRGLGHIIGGANSGTSPMVADDKNPHGIANNAK